MTTKHRFDGSIHKISSEETGFRGSIFLHVLKDDSGKPCEVLLSEKGHDGSDLDKLTKQFADAITACMESGSTEIEEVLSEVCRNAPGGPAIDKLRHIVTDIIQREMGA